MATTPGTDQIRRAMKLLAQPGVLDALLAAREGVPLEDVAAVDIAALTALSQRGLILWQDNVASAALTSRGSDLLDAILGMEQALQRARSDGPNS